MGQISESNKTKKQYLLQYRHLERTQKILEDELTQLMLDAAMPGSPGFEPHTPSGNIHDLSDYAVKYDHLYAKLAKLKARKWEIHEAILDRIKEMPTEVEKQLLLLRYIKGMSFVQIARELHYSEVQIWRIHGDALQHFRLPVIR